MKIQVIRYLSAAVLALAPAIASAQQEGLHKMPGQVAASQGADPAQVTACVEAQRHTSALVDAANGRLEAARQTNQPSAMRSAMEDLQTTLSTIRTQLATCTQLQAMIASAGVPPGHNMANMRGMNMPAAPNASGA